MNGILEFFVVLVDITSNVVNNSEFVLSSLCPVFFYLCFLSNKSLFNDVLFLTTLCGKGISFKVSQRVVQISDTISRVCETA